MPYTKQHKDKTRQRILRSAFQLFTTKGFECVTINDIMKNCGLTRGAFYAHFDSKVMLYSKAIELGANNSQLAQLKPIQISDQKWLIQLLDFYLSIEHVKGERACPLAFLVTDVVTQNSEAKIAYSKNYKGMNDLIYYYANKYSHCSKAQVMAVTAMIIGTVAIARTMDIEDDISTLLCSTRKEAGKLLGGI